MQNSKTAKQQNSKTTKQRIKQLLLLMTTCFFFGISLTSCEKDLYEEGIQNSSRNISVKDVSLSSLDKTTSSKINEKIAALKSLKNKTNDQGKFEYNSTLDVYIDTENGKLVNNDGKLYYTFPMFRKSEENLENIIFAPLDSGEMETYFAKYNVKPDEFIDLTITEIQNLNPVFQKLDAGTLEICTTLNFTVTTYSGCTATHPNNETCGGESVTFAFTTCYHLGGDGSDGNGTNTSPASYNGLVGGAGGSDFSTTPVGPSPEDMAIKEFVMQLSDDQNECLNGLPEDERKAVLDLLNPNPELDENCTGNTVTEEQQFDYLENVIDDICGSANNDPLPADTVLFENVSGKILDINEYLECFQLNQNAVFVLYVDQPIANNNATNNGTDPGHTFISIIQNNVRRVLGFYPNTGVYPGVTNTAVGVLVNNSNHEFDVSISYVINSTQLTNVINYIKNHANTQYNLNTYNCTDFGMGVTAASGLALPSAYGTWLGGGAGDNPGQLGQNIRNLPVCGGRLKNTTGGISPSNIGNCN